MHHFKSHFQEATISNSIEIIITRLHELFVAVSTFNYYNQSELFKQDCWREVN